MMSDDRKGSWFVTRNGKRFFPLDTRVEDICIFDIAHALSMICRFGGHSRRFYSVAEHSVLVSEVVPPEDALCGLLHDATEAYIGDMVRPLKQELPSYVKLENKLWPLIAEKFQIDPVMPPSVKHADNSVLLAEKAALVVDTGHAWPFTEAPAKVQIIGYSPPDAYANFLRRFYYLTEER
jgi:hypothetical protein